MNERSGATPFGSPVSLETKENIMAENETEEQEYVTFLDSEGNEISNDPRWHAKKRLKESGVDVDAQQDIIAQLEAQVAALQAQRGIAPQAASEDDDLDDDEDDNVKRDSDGNRTYEELDGKQLSALVKERELTIEGRKTVGAARAALIADDTAKREAAQD
jgi:hypothetical protein